MDIGFSHDRRPRIRKKRAPAPARACALAAARRAHLGRARPRRWRGALLPDHASLCIEVHEAEKRPVSAVADHFEVRDVRRVEVRMDRGIDLVMLHDPGHSLDERILREAVIYGDKLDVTEEITRLHSHFANFRKLANEPENPVGRSLDFMVQEIFRECNTLGNKAGSTEISPRVVMLKTELEKIREQVQNIE